MNLNRKITSSLSVFLAVIFLFVGCSGTQGNVEENSEGGAAISVETMKLEKSDIQNEYIYSGKVRAKHDANVISTVGGTVDQIFFDVGDQVKKGEALFQLNTEDIQNNLNILEAQVAASAAQLRSAQTALELVNGATMQTQIVSAKAGLAQAEIAYNDMKTTYSNNQQLYQAGIISKSDMDKTETGMKNAEIAYNQAKTSYDLIANQMPEENQRKAQDAVAAAQAAKQAAEAQMASAQKTLKDATVTSPIDGVVVARNVTEGSMYSSAAGAAFVISNLDQVYVDVGVSEQAVNSIVPQQAVDIMIKSVSSNPVVGSVETVSPGASQTGTYSVRILLPNPDGALKAGMFAEVHFSKNQKSNVLVLPRSVVLSDKDGSYVFLHKDGVVQKTKITTGVDTGEKLEVLSGLSLGDEIVTKGQSFLNDGDKVEVVGSSDATEEEE